MRIERFLVSCFVFLASGFTSLAQSNVVILSITNDWRYQQTANLDGISWQSTTFNDAGWPSGRALLYVENNTAVTPRNTLLTLGRLTYYFRTHFQFSGSSAGLGLVFTNLVDDGAVFYLNGLEVQRLRMPAAPQSIAYSTLATGTPAGGDAASPDVFTISGDALTNLLSGDNVLAVEVHQNTDSSTDIVFGSALSVVSSTGQFSFTEQPASAIVLDGRPALLRAATSASVAPALQWYKDGVVIGGANLTTLSFPTVSSANAGTYWVVASNSSLVLTSSQAMLTVQSDQIPPSVVRAVAQKDLAHIVIDFSEPVRPAATNLNNFQLTRSGQFSDGLMVISATLSNQTNLLLTTSSRMPRANYQLVLTNIVDLSSASNQVSAAPISLKYVIDLLRIDTNATWRYEQSGVCPPSNWLAPDFDDAGWLTGGSVFFFSRTGTLPPAPIGTQLQLTNLYGTGQATSYFFRTEFEMPGLTTNALSLRHIIDDGAALYLNGQPFYSIRLGFNGNCDAFASNTVGTPNYEPILSQLPITVSNTALPGVNWIAAEVHQSSPNNNDVAFAVSLEALIDEFVPGLFLTLPGSTTNGVGVLVNAGRVTLAESAGTNVVVTLSSTASSALLLPTNVTILAGETNALFNVTVSSNSSAQGPQRVTVIATANGFVAATKRIAVLDNIPTYLNLVLPASVSEGNGTFNGRVEVVSPFSQDITVTLTSSLPGAVGVPPWVILSAGQTSAVFQLVIPNNNLLEGTRSVTITARVPGWTNGTGVVSVLDKPDSYRALSLPTRDLAYDPVTQRIYASVPGSAPTNGNQIVPISPDTVSIEAGFSAGAEPGKILVASGGGKLYASVQTNQMVRRIDLLSRTTELSFPLETNPPANMVIEDFELLPGSPNPVAVMRLQNNFFATVAIYDEGVRRGSAVTAGDDAGQEVLEVATDGAALYVQNFGFQGFRRLVVEAQGVSTDYVDSTITPGGSARDWKAVDTRLFGSDGVVIDPLIPEIIATIPNIPGNSLMCYDAAIDRVFYLSPSGGNWVVRAYEASSLAPANTLTLTGVSGTPSTLIRWGQDGIAFRTDANQLFLLKTSLIATNPPSDIALSLSISSAPYFVSNSVTETIVITNRGTNPADLVSWTNVLPAGAVVGSAQGSAGSVIVNSNMVRGTITNLNSQTSVTVVVTFQPTVANIVQLAAAVASSARETNLANNSVTIPIWVRDTVPSANEILNVTVKDIARDPVRTRLYFSVGGNSVLVPNSILALDYAAGTLLQVPMNGDPGKLAVSGQGEFLYVGLDSGTGVRRLDLGTLVSDLSFPIPNFRRVIHMVVCPTNSGLVTIYREFDGKITAYENGIPRPNELGGDVGFLAHSDVTSDLYTCNTSGSFLHRLNIGATGVSILDSQPVSPGVFSGMKFSRGNLCFFNGLILNPGNRRQVATFPIPFNSLVEPDPLANRIFSLTVPNGVPGWAIRAFDPDQFTEVGYSFATLDSPSSFLRWGGDGFAFRTATQVYLLHSPLVPTNPPTDLTVRTTVSSGNTVPGETIRYDLCVTNLGSNTALGIVLTQAFSLSVTGLVAAVDAGDVTTAVNFVTWQIPSLAPGSGSKLMVSLRAAQEGTLVARAAVRHTANDPVLNNNSTLNITRIGNPSANQIREIALMTRELVYDRVRQRIYASIPAREPFIGNSVLSIDPNTAEVESLAFAGSEPDQLALSHDFRYLYVALNGSRDCRRIDLTGQLPIVRFPTNSEDSFSPYDMKVRPGFPEIIAVTGGFWTNESVRQSGVGLATDTGIRPLIARDSEAIVFSAGGDRIYSSVPFGGGLGFLRFNVNEQGVTLLDSTSAFYGDYDFKLDNGLLYSALGRVIEPNVPAVLATFGVNGPVEPDAQLGRIFQVPLSDTTTELRAYAMGSYQLLGTLPLPTARPYARHLIRCGGNRLAFRTDNGGQLFLLKTPLAEAPPVSTADLKVSQIAASLTNPDGVSFTVSIDNQGPGIAEDIRLIGILPQPVAAMTVQPSQGACGISNGVLTCSLGSLLAGGRSVVQLTAAVTNTAIFTNFVSVTSHSLDPVQTNNVSDAMIQSYFHQPTNTLRRFGLTARDLAFDPVRRRLFASLQETPNQSRLAWFDPETGAMQGTVSLAMRPDRLFASSDGNYLYVTGLSTSLIQRVYLPALTVDLNFNPSDASGQPGPLRVLPGQSTSCVISYQSTNGPLTAVFDNGVRRPMVVTAPYSRLAISPDGSSLYGYDSGGTGGASPDLFLMSIQGSGLTPVTNGLSDVPFAFSMDMELSQGRLYMGQGNVINTATWAEEAPFPTFNSEQRVEVDEAASRVILLATSTLGIYGQFSRQELTRFNISGVSGGLIALTRCGADRVAFLSANELFIVRNSALPAADITLRATGAPPVTVAGTNFGLAIVLSNAGPYTATNVMLTNLLPAQCTLLSASSSQGSITSFSDRVVLSLGTLPQGASAILSLTLRPTNSVDLVLTNLTSSVSAIPDPFPSNSILTVFIWSLADNDNDGLGDSWELAHFGSASASNGGPTNDFDGDGILNLQEFQNGTDPRDPLNTLRVQKTEYSNATVTVWFHGRTGHRYVIEQASSVLGSWSSVGNVLVGQGFPIVSEFAASQSAELQFYRLRELP